MPTQQDPQKDSSELLSEREAVHDRLLRDILIGAVEPTEEQPESEIGIQTKYELESRMPVRMALAVLAGEGLIRQRARHGFWLVQLDSEDLEEIAEMRAGVEGMVVEALASQLATTPPEMFPQTARGPFWQEAEKALKAMGNLSYQSGKDAEMADLDTSFHVALARAAGYDIAARHLVVWRNQFRLYCIQHRIHFSVTDLVTSHEEHAKLFSSVGKGISASDLARRHVMDGLKQAIAAVYA